MDYNVLGQLISQVGFPIIVAVYLLWFATKHVTENTKAMSKLKEAIDKLTDKMGGK